MDGYYGTAYRYRNAATEDTITYYGWNEMSKSRCLIQHCADDILDAAYESFCLTKGDRCWDGSPHDLYQSLDAAIYAAAILCARDQAQTVNVAAIREVIDSLYAPGHPVMNAAANKLAAALPK
jgi:hypothetical protein